MTDFARTTAIAASGMEAQSMRLRLISENIANADTPGYRRKLATFEAAGSDDGLLRLGPVRLDTAPVAEVHDPGHPLADADDNRQGSNVDIIIEMADAREAQRSYEANLRMFDQARQMSSDLLGLLRR
jgi:flagellar basal-body rod protein FlgC